MKETGNIFMSELTEVFSKRQQQFIQFAYSYVRDKEEAEDIKTKLEGEGAKVTLK